MKQFITLIMFLACVFSSCTGFYYIDGRLEPTKAGKGFQIENATDNSNNNYSDDLIDITWEFEYKSLGFKLTNKSNQVIKIHWNDVIYVDYNNTSCDIMHAGIKFSEREKEMKPSPIAPGTNFTDVIIPTISVVWAMDKKTNTYNWKNYGIAQSKYPTKERAAEVMKKLEDNGVKVLLPIEINGIIQYYIFAFKATGMKTYVDF